MRWAEKNERKIKTIYYFSYIVYICFSVVFNVNKIPIKNSLKVLINFTLRWLFERVQISFLGLLEKVMNQKSVKFFSHQVTFQRRDFLCNELFLPQNFASRKLNYFTTSRSKYHLVPDWVLLTIAFPNPHSMKLTLNQFFFFLPDCWWD